MDDWTRGPARWVAAVVLGGASAFGIAWSIAARRPVALVRVAEPVGPAVGVERAERAGSLERAAGAPVAPAEPVATGRIDLNTASAAELELLRGIGPTLAARIVAEREANGAFASVEDLRRVRGIGPKTVEGMRSMATVGGD